MALTFFWLGLTILSFAYLVFEGIRQEDLSFESGLLSFVAFTASFAPFLELGRLPLGFKRAMNAARNIFGLLDQRVVVDEGTEEVAEITQIAFEDVSFAYPQRQEQIFKHLSVAFSEKVLSAFKESLDLESPPW